MPYHDELLSGDDLTTLVLNFEWRRLVADALQSYLDRDANQLSDTEYDDAKERIYLLIHDLYTVEALSVPAHYQEAERTTTQAITANTQTPIQWSTGGTPPLFSFVTIGATGTATVAVRLKMTSAVGAVKTMFLIKNGVEVVRHDRRVNTANEWVDFAYVLSVASGDTLRVDVLCPQAMTVQIDDFTPKLSVVVVE